MTINELEKLNQARLKKRYHKIAVTIDDSKIYGILNSWKNGDRASYNKILKEAKCPSDEYYILGIWLHPLTKFQDLAQKIDRL